MKRSTWEDAQPLAVHRRTRLLACLVLAAALPASGCMVMAVGSAVVGVASTAVGVTTSAVGVAVDVTKAGVKAGVAVVDAVTPDLSSTPAPASQ